MYCGIYIRRWETMFVSLVGNPCLQSYIPTNIYTSIYLILIYKANFLPRTKKSLAATYQQRNVTISFIV